MAHRGGKFALKVLGRGMHSRAAEKVWYEMETIPLKNGAELASNMESDGVTPVMN